MSTETVPKRHITGIKIARFYLLATLVLITASGVALAAEKLHGNAMVSEVTSIYDADTFRATIQGWPSIIGERIPIRVNGIDAPEMRGKCREEIEGARKAKQEAVTMIRSAKVIELRNMQRGKYFRIVADVFLDGQSLADALVKKGLAHPYDGGRKEKWCQ